MTRYSVTKKHFLNFFFVECYEKLARMMHYVNDCNISHLYFNFHDVKRAVKNEFAKRAK